MRNLVLRLLVLDKVQKRGDVLQSKHAQNQKDLVNGIRLCDFKLCLGRELQLKVEHSLI